MLQKLEPSSGLDIFAAQFQVNIGVGQHLVVGMLGTDLIIVLREQDIALYASRYGDLRHRIKSHCQQQRGRQQQPSGKICHTPPVLFSQQSAHLVDEFLLGAVGVTAMF